MEATKKKEIIYGTIPRSQVVQQVIQQSTEKWQNQLDQTKGLITKQFFPNIKERLRQRIQLPPNLTAIVTAHGKTKDYPQDLKNTLLSAHVEPATKQCNIWYMSAQNYREREKS